MRRGEKIKTIVILLYCTTAVVRPTRKLRQRNSATAMHIHVPVRTAVNALNVH